MRKSGMTRALALAVLLGVTAGCQDTPPEQSTLHLLPPPGLPGGVEAREGADPSLAVDPDTGDLLLVWAAAAAGGEGEGAGEEEGGVWNLFVARSSDGGATFSEGVRVNDVPGDVHPHAEGAPRLVAGPGTLAVFWNNRVEAEGRRFAGSDLRFSRSVDGGKTWSPTTSLQDPLEPATLPPRAHTFHGATWTAHGALVVAWLDGRDRDARRLARAVEEGLPMDEAARTPEHFAHEDDPRDGDATVFAAISHDGGESWEASNRRIAGATCPCCRVSLVAAPDGSVLGSWRRHFDGSVRDPVVARFQPTPGASNGADGMGGEETPVHRIHDDGWVFHGCPHSGPALDLAPDGSIHAAWYTGADDRLGVYYARSAALPLQGDEATAPASGAPEGSASRFSAPLPVVAGPAVGIAHPAVVALPDGGAVVATNVDDMGERVILLLHISDSGEVVETHRVPDSDGGTHPQLVQVPGHGVVAAWTTSRGGIQRVQLARIDPRAGP